MEAYVWIAVGSALGGLGRFWLSGVVARRVGETFPWGTLAVNVSGAFVIGLFVAGAAVGEGVIAAPAVAQFFVIGILGSYTTVSSFSLNTLALLRDGDWPRAGGNIGLSLGLCLLAVALGHELGRVLVTP